MIYIRLLLTTCIMLCAFAISAQQRGFTNLNAADFNQMVASQPGSLIDVRTLREFRSGHLHGADMLNYYERDFRDRLLLLPKDQPVYLYCNTGYRSARAAQLLAQTGYEKVYNMQQGIMEWYYVGLPLISDPNAAPDTENVVSTAEFRQIIQNENFVFVDFYAPWCAPCREMMPMIDELLPKYAGQIHLLKVNVDGSRNLARDLKLMGVPYLVLYKNGEPVYTHFGKVERDDLEKVFKEELRKP